MVKEHQLNIRLDSVIISIFNQIAKEMNLSPGTLGTKVITDFVQFYYYKIERGDLTISQPILKSILQYVNHDKIDDISKFQADYILSEIKAQEGTVTYDKLVTRAIKWNKGNHLIFNQIKQNGSDIFVSKHSLGKQWSELQCKTYSNLFEKIGETILEREYDSDISFSLEIARHE